MVNLRDRRRQGTNAPEGASYNDRGVLVFHDLKSFSRYLRGGGASKHPMVLGEERPGWGRRLSGLGLGPSPLPTRQGLSQLGSEIFTGLNVAGEATALGLASIGGFLKDPQNWGISPESIPGGIGDWVARKQLQPGTRESTWDKWPPGRGR